MTVTVLNARKAPLDIARELVVEFALTAVERDAKGGTPKHERNLLRDSGLLAMSIPGQFDGLNATWSETFEVVRAFARVDSSIAHVFGFHHLMLATVRLFAKPSQWQTWFKLTANKNWFWGNTLNPLDTRTVVKDRDGWRDDRGRDWYHRGIDDGRFDHQPFDYHGQWVNPVWDNGHHAWGFWLGPIWIPL